VAPNHPGDLEIQWNATSPIFIEVKGPGWEGELTVEEKRGTRKRKPKYINAEGRWVDSVKRIMYSVEKAMPKFASGRPNLLVVSVDLFVSPLDMAQNILVPRLISELKQPEFARVGGLLLFNPICNWEGINYRTRFIQNSAAEAQSKLPFEVVKSFTM
jgi:hypothetical protein